MNFDMKKIRKQYSFGKMNTERPTNGDSSDISSKVKLATVWTTAPFSIATTPRCRGGCYSFTWITPLYPYLIILSVKQGSIKYRF